MSICMKTFNLSAVMTNPRVESYFEHWADLRDQGKAYREQYPDDFPSGFPNAQHVAEYFLSANRGLINIIQLSGYLYLAQGHTMAKTGKGLIHEQMMAWKFCPIFPNFFLPMVYDVKCGPHMLNYQPNDLDIGVFTEEQFDILKKVHADYNGFTGDELMHIMTAPGTPWEITWNKKGKKFLRIIEKAKHKEDYLEIIPEDMIKEHFSNDIHELYPSRLHYCERLLLN